MSEMAGIEKPVTGIQPYDLHVPDRMIYPVSAPLRDGRRRYTPPRYVPAPLPEGVARVTLSDDYYLGPCWDDYRDSSSPSPDAVFDVPADQRDRWQQVMGAYGAMQGEIRALMEARRRSPEPAKRGAYIPQP